MSAIFWTNSPSILTNKEHIREIWPTSTMYYENKLNAVTRLTIVLTILGYKMTHSIRAILMGVTTLIIIVLVHMHYVKTGKMLLAKNEDEETEEKEGFSSADSKGAVIIDNPVTLQRQMKDDFIATTSRNPFSNVLLTDIGDTPDRKSAPPAFQSQVHNDITKATKKMIQDVNKDIPNIDKHMFGSLGENYDFDLSLRSFNSTPNTRVANDQGAFAQYLYGNMPSCKDGDVLQCSANNQRHNLH